MLGLTAHQKFYQAPGGQAGVASEADTLHRFYAEPLSGEGSTYLNSGVMPQVGGSESTALADMQLDYTIECVCQKQCSSSGAGAEYAVTCID